MILAQPAVGTARARIRQSVRACVLVAVLLGLFLMHGGPAAAAGGCHGAMPDTDTAVPHAAPARAAAHMDAMRPAPAMTAGHPDPVRPATAPTAVHPAAHPAAAAAEAAPRTDEAMRGALCLATTPRSAMPSPPIAASALVFPAAVLLPWARHGSHGIRRRGPPAGGRQLLLQVCIART
ncbi:hypothetical protein [Streptomyces barringtoniae]|uniref:hypothetical protein n=1 Tax=Streptomyces barringtoniae TaxID=2892029 RepID=UPI001E4C4141|nr:hypothetical protein [Streptomyces barringtoniae]MCC5476919.1 hypothetical protein [Streptomyces barringtoniae]